MSVETGTAGGGLFCDPFVVLQIFGNTDLPGLALLNQRIDPLHQAPAVRDVVCVIIVLVFHIPDRTDGIPAEPVDKTLLQPAQRVIAQILPDFIAAIVKTGLTPCGCAPPIVVEIDAALPVLRPSVELPHVP